MRQILGVAMIVFFTSASAQAQKLTLTLQDCIRAAQEQGPTAHVARKSFESSRWMYQAFSARLLPQVSLSGSLPNFNRSIIPVVQPDGTTQYVSQGQSQSSMTLTVSQRVAATGGEVFFSSSLSRLDLLNDRSVLWQTSPLLVGFRQDLFRPNDIGWDAQEQDLRSEAAERQYREAREDVAVDATAAFFDVYIAKILLENATDNVVINDTLFTLSKGRFEVGKIAESDLLQSELAVMNARTDAAAAQLQYDRSLSMLKILLNLPRTTEIDVKQPPLPPAPTVDATRAAQQALRNRSDVVNATLQRTQVSRRLNEAELASGFSATISAVAGWNQTAGVLPDAYKTLLDQQRISMNIQVPILQWGAGKASVEAALADQDRITTSTALSEQYLEQDARFAAVQFAQLQRQIVLAGKADTIATRRFEVAKNRYVIGKTGTSDLFIAQNERSNARRSLIQTLRDYWVAYYRLRRLTLYDWEQQRAIVPDVR